MSKTANNRECAVPLCSSTQTTKNPNINFFSFPNNPIHRKVWARLISRREENGDLWMPQALSKVCSLHFVNDDFRKWAGYHRLLPNAIPTLFPSYPPKIQNRQKKIIENFRREYPLGVELPIKVDPPPKKRLHNEDDQEAEDAAEESQSNSEKEGTSSARKTRSDTSDQERNEEKTFKKRKTENEESSTQEFEHDSKNNEDLGRGMRPKKRSVKIDLDSDENNDESQNDDDYTPAREQKKRSSKNYVLEDLNDLNQSPQLRKIALLEKRIHWKEEQMLSLNQKAVVERNKRIKIEEELAALRKSMEGKGDSTKEVIESSRTGAPECGVGRKTAELERTIKILKAEVAEKDRILKELKKMSVQVEPKNKYTRKVKEILENSILGEAKALFLLEQIECYGETDVSMFRMSTIKKCVEWKLVNVRGYEAVRNLEILTLPSTRLLRDHVDILVDTGVMAEEGVTLHKDLTEVMEELGETSKNNTLSEVDESSDDLPAIINKTRRMVKMEKSPIKDQQLDKWMTAKKGATTQDNVIDQSIKSTKEKTGSSSFEGDTDRITDHSEDPSSTKKPELKKHAAPQKKTAEDSASNNKTRTYTAQKSPEIPAEILPDAETAVEDEDPTSMMVSDFEDSVDDPAIEEYRVTIK